MHAKQLSVSFARILSSVYQQGLLTKEKKDHLLKEWGDATRTGNTDAVDGLVMELEPYTEGNDFLYQEIQKMKEEQK